MLSSVTLKHSNDGGLKFGEHDPDAGVHVVQVLKQFGERIARGIKQRPVTFLGSELGPVFSKGLKHLTFGNAQHCRGRVDQRERDGVVVLIHADESALSNAAFSAYRCPRFIAKTGLDEIPNGDIDQPIHSLNVIRSGAVRLPFRFFA